MQTEENARAGSFASVGSTLQVYRNWIRIRLSNGRDGNWFCPLLIRESVHGTEYAPYGNGSVTAWVSISNRSWVNEVNRKGSGTGPKGFFRC